MVRLQMAANGYLLTGSHVLWKDCVKVSFSPTITRKCIHAMVRAEAEVKYPMRCAAVLHILINLQSVSRRNSTYKRTAWFSRGY